ncbi:hypothetical protein E2C01_015032 [Portunus trituberculatus]|uniref:Uncharacterized protein n=1 Tax=Portunus trituberculatus TaxID=210409 RepID=A0A5B7DM26_PORTR|nr:hypothetical protein [Portunus trituberculatus]
MKSKTVLECSAAPGKGAVLFIMASTQPHRAILLTANQPGVKKWPGMKLHYYDTHIPHSTTQHTPHGTTVSLRQRLRWWAVMMGRATLGPAWRGGRGTVAVPHKAFQGDMSEAPLRPVLRLPLTHLPHQPRQYLHSAPSRHSCLASPPGLGEYLLLFGCFRDQLFSWKTPKLAVDLPSAQSLGSLPLPPYIFSRILRRALPLTIHKITVK